MGSVGIYLQVSRSRPEILYESQAQFDAHLVPAAVRGATQVPGIASRSEGEGSWSLGVPEETMRLSGDELAGVTDLFGALEPGELKRCVQELAFRRGEDFDPGTHSAAVDAAVSDYQLVEVSNPMDTQTVLAPGPTAFPTLPEEAEDLPHILDLQERSLDREAVGSQVETRLRGEAARAVSDGDTERVATLLDVSYDLEAWAPVEIASARERLATALEGA